MEVAAFRIAKLGILTAASLSSANAVAQTPYQAPATNYHPPATNYHPPATYYRPGFRTPSNTYIPPQTGNAIGNLFGGFLRAGMVSQARAAWSSYDPAIVQCINTSGRVTVSFLVGQGILPNDGRVANLIGTCQARIAQSAAQAQQQAELAQQRADQAREQASEQAALDAKRAAEAKAEAQEQRAAEARRASEAKAAEQAALDNERTEAAARAAKEAADLAASESLAAQNQKRRAMFLQFQTKTVDPNDRVAALLNYTTYGSDSGTADSFWARKNGNSSVYVQYKEGAALAEPVISLREVDTLKIDSSNFFVKGSESGVTVLIHGDVFAECSSCVRASVQSRWIDFFTSRSK